MTSQKVRREWPIDRFTYKQQRFLRRRVQLDAPDIRSMTRAELPQYFSRKSGELNESRLVMTFVFQYFVLLQEGSSPPIGGNIRTFWYQRLRKELERLGLFEQVGGLTVASSAPRSSRYLKLMENSFEAMFKQEFFRYQDIGVYDQRAGYRLMGRDRKRHLFYVEKEGWMPWCKLIQPQFSFGVYASRGSASWVDVDYLSAAIAKLDVRSLIVGALTDWDPWGVFIAHQIKMKLDSPIFNFRTIKLHQLTDLGLFTPEAIQGNKRYLLNGHEDPEDPVHQVVMDWVAQGGGINGEPYGIHIDSADRGLILKRLEKWVNGKFDPKVMELTMPATLRKRIEKRMGVTLA